MINWVYFPQSDRPTEMSGKVVKAFERHSAEIDSETHDPQTSNEVLAKITATLTEIGFRVETGKKGSEKIRIPVLFGRQGRAEKSFDADAYDDRSRFVIEVEAGRGVTNNQFLKDLFEGCMMHDVDYLAIAVRNICNKTNKDFETVVTFFDTLYKSSRLSLPLKGLLVIGY